MKLGLSVASSEPRNLVVDQAWVPVLEFTKPSVGTVLVSFHLPGRAAPLQLSAVLNSALSQPAAVMSATASRKAHLTVDPQAVEAVKTLNGQELAGRKLLVREDREDRDVKQYNKENGIDGTPPARPPRRTRRPPAISSANDNVDGTDLEQTETSKSSGLQVGLYEGAGEGKSGMSSGCLTVNLHNLQFIMHLLHAHIHASRSKPLLFQ